MLNAKITFYTMLANLVAAGLSLDRALSKGIPRPLRKTCARLRKRLTQGATLSEAMCEERKTFSNLELALVMVGESTGTLDRSASFLRDHFTRFKALRSQLITSLAYPIFTYVVAIPLLTLAELATSQVGTGGLNFEGWGRVIAIRCLLGWGIPLLALFFGRFLLTGLFKSSLLGTLLNAIPFLGGIQHTYNSAVFWNALGTCLTAGLTYGKAIKLSANACPNNLYRNKFKKLAMFIDEGKMSFTEAFERIAGHRDERCQFTALASTGEATGKLDDAAFRMGALSEEITRTSLKRFTAIFPLVVYLILAGYLAFKIVGFYASYFNKILSL